MDKADSSCATRGTLSIIMYHYVRPPGLRSGLHFRSLDQFKKQLTFLSSKYNILTPNEFRAVISGQRGIEGQCCYLTFDDGYIDHFRYVLPVLLEYKMKAGFFVPVNPIDRGKPLDVNKIQYLLGVAEPASILNFITRYANDKFGLVLERNLKSKGFHSSRYGTESVRYLKALLQYMLPLEVRTALVEKAFDYFVGIDDEELCGELYMTREHIDVLLDLEMEIGGHGLSHVWLGKETKEKVSEEMQATSRFLHSFGIPQDEWTLCYPSGSFNEAVIQSAKKYGATAGLTTIVGVNVFDDLHRVDGAYSLKRLDTNDLPH